jgi:hypothetical protein
MNFFSSQSVTAVRECHWTFALMGFHRLIRKAFRRTLSLGSPKILEMVSGMTGLGDTQFTIVTMVFLVIEVTQILGLHFPENNRSSSKFGIHFYIEKMHKFQQKNRLGYILGDFFQKLICSP